MNPSSTSARFATNTHTHWGCPTFMIARPRGWPDSEGIGNFCLMAGGSYGGDGNHADTPVPMSAWCKYFLGWAPVQTITSDGIMNVASRCRMAT